MFQIFGNLDIFKVGEVGTKANFAAVEIEMKDDFNSNTMNLGGQRINQYAAIMHIRFYSSQV